MSTTFPSLEPDETVSSSATLAELRVELDRIDDAMHALLIQRALVVERVGAVKSTVALRPGREAAILRRLLGQHTGHLPRQALVRIWRELFAGTTSMQGQFSITACDVDRDGAYAQLSREHFGVLTPLRVHRSPTQAIAEISRGAAAAAVLPMPLEQETGEHSAWWTALLNRDAPRIHIVARLPFWSARPEGAAQAQALVLSAVAPDPSGADRSLIGLELPADLSRARLTGVLAAADLASGNTILRRDPGASYARALIDVQGFVHDADPRLAALAGPPQAAVLRPPVVLGSYALPIPPSGIPA
jgi:chorismate mutase